MDIYQSEEETVKELKQWWKDNGTSIIVGIILGGGAVFGSRMWFENQTVYQKQASAQYEQLLSEIDQKQEEGLLERGELIKQDYKDSNYAKVAALLMAKLYVEKGELDAAAVQLEQLANHKDKDFIQIIAKIRLARVYRALEKPDQAEAMVKQGIPEQLSGLSEEVLGDIYYSKGEMTAAKLAYDKAKLAGPADLARLEMKIADLGLTAKSAS